MPLGAVDGCDPQNFLSTFCASTSLICDKALLNLALELFSVA